MVILHMYNNITRMKTQKETTTECNISSPNRGEMQVCSQIVIAISYVTRNIVRIPSGFKSQVALLHVKHAPLSVNQE